MRSPTEPATVAASSLGHTALPPGAATGRRPRRLRISWRWLLIALVTIIMVIPVRRYAFPIPTSFAVEPYRVMLALLACLIIVALLTDRGFRWQRLTFGGVLALYLATQLISIAVNLPTLVERGLVGSANGAIASVVLMASTFFIVRMLVTTERSANELVTLMVGIGAVTGVLVAFERVTRVNLFIEFADLLPLMHLSLEDSVFVKEGTARAFGAAQHPIALAVYLCMLIPLAIYQSRHARWPVSLANRQLFWLGATLCIAIGMIAAVSRTGIVMLFVMAVIFVIMRPSALSRLLVFGIPAAGVAYLASPRNVGAMVENLLSPQALIESQLTAAGMTGSGRLADLGPSLAEAALNPVFGTALGSRITTGRLANAFILDNQLLSTLLESGIVGVIGVIALVLVPAFRMLSMARARRANELGVTDRNRDLALAIGISMVGYFVCFFFLDAFSFLQTFLLFFILLGIASWLANTGALARRRLPEMETTP